MRAPIGLMVLALWLTAADARDPPEAPQAPGTLTIPQLTLPPSSFLSAQTRAALDAEREAGEPPSRCGELEKASAAQAPAIRRCQWEEFYQSALFRHLHALYAVGMTPRTLGGVYTEVFTPARGVAPGNRRRVLINVHGGGFIEGSRVASHFESIPIAAVGGFKVVSIDYRQAPEHEFPAAVDDVVAVYRELLKSYEPARIGLYGCSAGGLLTAETTARLVREKLPLPGAIALLCEGAGYWTEGDSGSLKVLSGGPVWSESRDNPYFRHVDPADARAFPVRAPDTLRRFPPTLLVSSTRDPALSSVVHTHSLLVSLDVKAELHVWEGLDHAFMGNPDLPPSREVYKVTTRFFDHHLAR